jgi:hypothetical protein
MKTKLTKTKLSMAIAGVVWLANCSSFGQSVAGSLGWYENHPGQTPNSQNNNLNAAQNQALNNYNAIIQQNNAFLQNMHQNTLNTENQIMNIYNQNHPQNQQNQQDQNDSQSQNQYQQDNSDNQNQGSPQMAASYRKAAQAYYDAADKETDPANASCDRAWGDYYSCVADSYIAGTKVDCIQPTCQPGSGQSAPRTTYNINGQSGNQSQFDQSLQQQVATNNYYYPAVEQQPEPAHALVQLSSFFSGAPAPPQKTAASSDDLSWITGGSSKTSASTNAASSPDIVKQLNDVLR